ncbi:hypothetical protein K474DRAFT_623995 [Panus rudis PR-1116 ss-1]|nr:hypothetical protein K474DRAFT_623995 [Panus rudis PR-1116 ss-1]
MLPSMEPPSGMNASHAGPHSASGLSRAPSYGSAYFPNDSNTVAQWRIPPGSFIAFSIDTSSVAQQYPVGSATRENIQRFPVGRYVGVVITSYTLPADTEDPEDEPVEEITVHFVGGSPPPANALSDHWMAISPTTQPSLQTPPLQTKPLFPWQDRYQWTSCGTRLHVRQLHESSLKFRLEEEEFARLEDHIMRDLPQLVATAEYEKSVMGDTTLDRLKVPEYCLPAVVWRDIRTADRRDEPAEFWNEVTVLAEYCDSHTEDCSSPSADAMEMDEDESEAKDPDSILVE